MVSAKSRRLGRDDWIRGALELLSVAGVEGVRIVPLAERLGVTSGSFYWHFKNRRELHDALLEYWQREMTDAIMETVKAVEPPEERIWKLMRQVMSRGLARYDLAIWHWAQTDAGARKAFKGTLKRRFAFAKWLFEEAGFSDAQAEARGRLMVVYMTGESNLVPDAHSTRKNLLRSQYEILIHA